MIIKKIICCLVLMSVCMFVISLSSCAPKDDDLDCAEYIFRRDPEFVEKYGKIDSVKRIGESVDSDDQTERYVYCEITLKDGTVINCTAILELNVENKSVAPLFWMDGYYTGQTVSD